jgi:SAM-dependent methyltransferase
MIHLSDEDIAEAFEPAIRSRLPPGDAEWRRTVRRLRWGLLRRATRTRFPRWKRTPEEVHEIYEKRWHLETGITRFDLSTGHSYPTVWGERQYLAQPLGVKRVHLLYLMRIIERFSPRSVLEVGCGMGTNLAILANRFPDVAFHGIELTAAGRHAAEELRALSKLPDVLTRFSPLPLSDTSAHRRILVDQGNAADLPYDSYRFDLVYSVQALEQMESVRPRVLASVARVTRSAVAMFEPFADWNGGLWNRLRIAADDYFRGRVVHLEGVGLTPTLVTDNMPQKAFYGVGLVVAEKSTAP